MKYLGKTILKTAKKTVKYGITMKTTKITHRNKVILYNATASKRITKDSYII